MKKTDYTVLQIEITGAKAAGKTELLRQVIVPALQAAGIGIDVSGNVAAQAAIGSAKADGALDTARVAESINARSDRERAPRPEDHHLIVAVPVGLFSARRVSSRTARPRSAKTAKKRR